MQAAKQPPHWAPVSLYSFRLLANSHLPVKKLLTPPMTGENVWVCVHRSVYGRHYIHYNILLYLIYLCTRNTKGGRKNVCSIHLNLINYAAVCICTCIINKNKNAYHHVPATALVNLLIEGGLFPCQLTPSPLLFPSIISQPGLFDPTYLSLSLALSHTHTHS